MVGFIKPYCIPFIILQHWIQLSKWLLLLEIWIVNWEVLQRVATSLCLPLFWLNVFRQASTLNRHSIHWLSKAHHCPGFWNQYYITIIIKHVLLTRKRFWKRLKYYFFHRNITRGNYWIFSSLTLEVKLNNCYWIASIRLRQHHKSFDWMSQHIWSFYSSYLVISIVIIIYCD